MSIPNLNKDLAVVQKLNDLPNSTDGLTAAQLKAKFDEAGLEIQSWINNTLIPALKAANIPFEGSDQLAASDVQAAITLVHSQIRDASSGTIVDGAVTKEKLAAELLGRVFGGRVWVSLDKPTEAENPAAEFPVGQLWLRPGVTVTNAVTDNWTASACTVQTEENKVIVTGRGDYAQATATLNLSGIGQTGDRVYVLFGISDKDTEITSLTVSLNDGAEESTSAAVHTASLVGGSLAVKFRAAWPSSSLADGSFAVDHLTVVNIDQIMRQTADCKEASDWGAYLQSLMPFVSYQSPRELYIQTKNGLWQQLDHEVFPVERGGTGVSSVASGELLYGSGGSNLEKLEAPEAEGSVLQFSEGRPQWNTLVGIGALQKAAGTYTGDGVNGRTVTLPVTPVFVMIYPSNGGDDPYQNDQEELFLLPNGYTKTGTTGSGSSSYRVYAALSGNTLTFTYQAKSSVSNQTTGLGNRRNVKYNWIAIY